MSVCVCCGTLKKPVCGFKNASVCTFKRPRVCRHHAHMCFNMKAWCRYTRGRYERAHGDVLSPHTESRGEGVGHRQFCLPNLPTLVITSFRGSPKKLLDLSHSSLRKDREQHVPDSSNYSLYLMKLFSFSNLEENFGGNQQPDGSSCLSNSPSLPSPPPPQPQPPHTTHRDKETETQRQRETEKEDSEKDVSHFKLASPSIHFHIHLHIRSNVSIYNICIHVLSRIIKDTTFEMELCGKKQATAHAHVQSSLYVVEL